MAVFADGRIVRFHRSIERTIASIAEIDAREAKAYRRFMDVAVPLLDPLVAWMRAGGGGRGFRAALKDAPAAVRAFVGQPRRIATDLGATYGRVLEERLGSVSRAAPSPRSPRMPPPGRRRRRAPGSSCGRLSITASGNGTPSADRVR